MCNLFLWLNRTILLARVFIKSSLAFPLNRTQCMEAMSKRPDAYDHHDFVLFTPLLNITSAQLLLPVRNLLLLHFDQYRLNEGSSG